jgi:uncharacterized protein HemX
MKKQTNTNRLICSSLALAFTLILTLAIWSPVQAQSSEPAEGKNLTEAKMMDHCQKMKEQKQKMKEDMQSQDSELTKQVAEMNRAPKDKKLNLMAAVITNMVEQRIAMDARKARMEEEMMKHMMLHMQMGKESMAQCPMMKDMDEKSGGDHNGHQKE